jgi:hypothetical protein
MRAIFLTSLALLTAATVPAMADSTKLDGRSIERVVEAMTSMIVLPVSVNGTLSYQLCPSCRTVALSATPTTQYLIGNQLVSLESMAKLFSSGHNYTAAVAAQLDAPVLTRLQVFPADLAPGAFSP